MYLNDYVKKFGKLSFKERPFGNVDALILTTVVFSNLEAFAPSINDSISFPAPFHSICRNDFEMVNAKNVIVPTNPKLIELMMESKRFGNVCVKYILKRFDAVEGHQFFAATFEIPDVGNFVAFRGTDKTVAGWKENFESGVSQKVESQLLAVGYLNDVAKLTKGPLYVGGFSKGGHSTLYSCVFCGNEAKERIVYAYDFDGNGLSTNDYYTSPDYLAIKDRILFFKPHDAIIGELLYAPKTYKVVECKGHGLGQHNPDFWKIDEESGDFIYTDINTKNALIIHWATKEWLKNHSYEDKILLFDFVIALLGGTGAMMNNVSLSHQLSFLLIKSKKKFTEEERKRVKRLFKEFLVCRKTAIKRYKLDGDKKQKEYTAFN